MNPDQTIKKLNQEIEKTEQNFQVGSPSEADYKEGFLEGLHQAILVILAEKDEKNEPQSRLQIFPRR